MKKYICIMIICLFSLSSCEDYLDLKPRNVIATETLPDVKAMMSSYLFYLTTYYERAYYNDNQFVIPMNRDLLVNCCIYSDDFNSATYMNGRYARYFSKQYYTGVDWKSEKFGEQIWKEFYSTIGFLNTIIFSLDNLDDKSSAEYFQVRSEALVYRSFCIFKLLQFFSPYTNDNLGIPLVLNPEIIEPSKRLSQTKVFNVIINDLESVLSYNTVATKWNVYYSKPIVNLLLSKVYMYKAESGAKEADDWKNAEKYSASVVKDYSLISSSSDYTPFTNLRKVGVFKNDKLALLTISSKRQRGRNLSAPFGTSSSNRLLASEGLYKLYDADDIRLSAYFDSNMAVKKWSYNYYVREYIHMFRIADAYLVNAEANFRISNTAKAKEVLEKFKSSRISSFTSYDGSDLLGEILKERRKEFCYEFEHRWVDMKRLGITVTRLGKSEDSQSLVEYTLKSDDYRYTLPIPVEAELKFNNIIQNPGWN